MTKPSLENRIRGALAYVQGFPDHKYNFPDITPILEGDPILFHDTIAEILRLTQGWSFDTVLCVESFGYVFGVPLAYERGSKIALMRRPGKLPRTVLRQSYSMCYDNARSMELHKSALTSASRVIIVDDFLVSGGTAAAGLELIKQAEASAVGVVCIVENVSWQPRAVLSKYQVPIITLATIT